MTTSVACNFPSGRNSATSAGADVEIVAPLTLMERKSSSVTFSAMPLPRT
jgi:hypothetical protein